MLSRRFSSVSSYDDTEFLFCSPVSAFLYELFGINSDMTINTIPRIPAATVKSSFLSFFSFSESFGSFFIVHPLLFLLFPVKNRYNPLPRI